MTAVPDWDSSDPRIADAELVRGAREGDRAAFAQIYDRYADRLHDFTVGMLRDRDGAADCVQETFCVAATRLHQLREPDKLRPWLYSIARNEALRQLRDRRRETPSDELPDVPSDDAGPDTLSARTELAELISEAAHGLSDRDRALLDLTFRHGLDGPELADALGVSHVNANTMAHRLRRTIERSLGALLVSRRAHHDLGGCTELREILAGWDGQFTVLMRKRVSRHIESCPTCDEERRRLVSPAALLGATPAFIPAPEWLRDRTLGDIQLVSHDSPMDGAPGDASGSARRRTRVWLAGASIAVLGAAAVLLLGWMSRSPVTIVPAEVSESTVQAPALNDPPPPPIVQQQQPPAQTLAPSPPSPNGAPATGSPPLQTPVVEPTPEPSTVKPSPPSRVPPPKPPSSFRPTVVATPPAVPPSSGGGGGGGGGGGPVGAGGP